MGGGKKKAKRARAWIVFQDESGVSQKPPIRRTWAPRGQTPVIIHPFNWKKLSICSFLVYRWDGTKARVYFQITPDSYNKEKLIKALKEIKKHFRGQKVIMVWDGLPAHKSCLMREYLRGQKDWLQVVQLPGYAPDLNPVESLWGNIQRNELANRLVDDLGGVVQGIGSGFRRVISERHLLFSFLHHAGLFFDT